MGGWRNALSARKAASEDLTSSQDCLVWSVRRSRRQGREGKPNSCTLGKASGHGTQAGDDSPVSTTYRTATLRQNLTAFATLGTSLQQATTAPSQQPPPLKPTGQGETQQQQSRDDLDTRQNHRCVDFTSHELATGIGAGRLSNLDTSAAIEMTASDELPVSQARPSPSPSRYTLHRPRRRADGADRPR